MIKKFLLHSSLFLAFFLMIGLSALANPVYAEGGDPQAESCQECHAEAVTLWQTSNHGSSSVTCLVCHKLSEGEGTHPTIHYTVEDESVTCVVCHTNVAEVNVAGQLQASKHGEVGLKCVTCHEPHSQTSVLSEGSTIVCDNCHQNQMKEAQDSTHHAAGLNCINCHMGEERSHTLLIGPDTCGGCHSDIHSANRILASGAKIQPITTPMVKPENSQVPVEEPVADAKTKGVSLPSWLGIFVGILIGSVVTWVLFGREPGEPKR